MNLPFYKIFEAFRQKKYPLGIGEYNALIEVLTSRGVFTPTATIIEKQELLELCKILWLKPNQVPYVFESIFNESYSRSFVRDSQNSIGDEIKKEDSQPSSINTKSVEDQTLKNAKPDKEQNTEEHDRSSEMGDGDLRFFRYIVGEAGRNVSSYAQHSEPETKQKFLFADNYLPISKRDIFQVFNGIPQKKLGKTKYEIDIEAMINSITSRGYLTEIIFRMESEIINNVIILHDCSGSMEAFEGLSEAISEAISELYNGRYNSPDKFRNFYFENVVQDFVYLNKQRTQYQTVENFIKKYKERRTDIIIISDAGAARGNNSNLRVAGTIEMLMNLKKITTKIVWLNPFPSQRWNKTSALRISTRTPMFPIDSYGLQNATSCLRGRQIIKVKD